MDSSNTGAVLRREVHVALDDPDASGRQLQVALAHLAEPDLLASVVEERLGSDDDPQALAAFAEAAERLLRAADGAGDRSAGHWLLAVVDERRGDAVAAEAHLRAAVEADGEWGPAVDRMAWYCSDRGDAAGAVRLWRRLADGPDLNRDLFVIEPFARSAGRGGARNDSCPCGSGRKFKHCHLGQPEQADLADRVGWLSRKSVAYLERRGGGAMATIRRLATITAVDPGSDGAVAEASHDPLVVDIALVECGWFARFLADRGPLLPDDERELATAWLAVRRTVFEVTAVRSGLGLILSDRRTGEPVEVQERVFSRHASVGQVVCGRAAPDGVGFQFVGSLFSVPPGQADRVMGLVDEGDGEALLAEIAAQHVRG